MTAIKMAAGAAYAARRTSSTICAVASYPYDKYMSIQFLGVLEVGVLTVIVHCTERRPSRKANPSGHPFVSLITPSDPNT